PAGMAVPRARKPIRLGWWKLPACLLLAGVALAGIIVPLVTILFWFSRHPEGLAGALDGAWARSLGDSISAALPAAILATLLALPIAYMARRYSSRFSRGIEQSAYLGYATPALAFALGLVFFSLRVTPWLYQTLFLLIYAYALHFLAEAVGPIRSALYVATPRLEEASRSLGWGRIQTFYRVTLPLLRSGIVVSVALVFLSAMKELPLTFILSPLGFETLAKNLWSHTNEAMFAEAAPYALTILIFSGLFVGLLLLRGHEEVS
ncbi:MAG: ABC transporter permease subunit, partial [Phycisphaeraceae bacterium]